MVEWTAGVGLAVNRAIAPTQAVYSFQGPASVASDYTAIVTISPSESLKLQGDQVVSGPAGVTGYIVGSPDGSFKVVVSDPAEPVGQQFQVVVSLPTTQGEADKQSVRESEQAVFSFTGRERFVRSPSDYKAIVTISPGKYLTLQGNQVVSGPAGVIGYIAPDPDGSLRVAVSDPAAPAGQEFPVVVEEVEYPGVPFRGGKAVNQVFDPQQLVYSFEGAGKASDYKMEIIISQRIDEILTVKGGQVVSGPAGITGYIVGSPTAPSRWLFVIPSRGSARRSTRSRSIRSMRRFPRCARNPPVSLAWPPNRPFRSHWPSSPSRGRGQTSVANNYTAIVTISPGESLTLRGDTVVSGPAGVTGYIVGSPDGSFKVVVSDPAEPLGQEFPVVVKVKVNAPGPAGVSSLLVAVAEGSAVNQAFPTTQAIFHFDGTGTDSVASDYRAIVYGFGGPDESSRSRATRSCRSRRASPAIWPNPDGSFKVVVRDLSASIGEEYFFDVQKVNKPGLPFKGGVVFNQAVTPTQPIFSFEGTGRPATTGRSSKSAPANPSRPAG